MSYVRRIVVDVTTDGSGNATAYSSDVINGLIHSIRLVADGTSPFDNTADITITGETTGLPVLAITNQNSSGTFYPRAGTVDGSNAASLYAAGGAAVNDKVALADERLKIVVAQGGATKSGRFHVLVA